MQRLLDEQPEKIRQRGETVEFLSALSRPKGATQFLGGPGLRKARIAVARKLAIILIACELRDGV